MISSLTARYLSGSILSGTAAEDVSVKYRNGLVPMFGGSTDSAAFTQGGFRSVGITGLNRKLEDYYHTREDSCDNPNMDGLEQCYRATTSFVGMIEKMNDE